MSFRNTLGGLVIFCFIAMSILNSCQNNDDICVSIKFHPIDLVPDSAWIKLDNYQFIHTPHNFEWKTKAVFPKEEGDGFFGYIPTSKVFFYHPNNSEKRVMEKISNFEINKRFGGLLSTIKEDDEQVYKIVNGKEYLVHGIMKLQRLDGKRITFSHSDDNPVTIRYQKRTSGSK